MFFSGRDNPSLNMMNASCMEEDTLCSKGLCISTGKHVWWGGWGILTAPGYLQGHFLAVGLALTVTKQGTPCWCSSGEGPFLAWFPSTGGLLLTHAVFTLESCRLDSFLICPLWSEGLIGVWAGDGPYRSRSMVWELLPQEQLCSACPPAFPDISDWGLVGVKQGRKGKVMVLHV